MGKPKVRILFHAAASMASGSGSAFWEEGDSSVATVTDVERLKRAWRNEKAAPEILQFEADLVERAREQIQLQVVLGGACSFVFIFFLKIFMLLLLIDVIIMS